MNPAEKIVYMKEYRLRNREKMHAQNKAWLAAQPGGAAARAKKWRDENPEKRQVQKERHKRKHPEVYAKASAKWSANNRSSSADASLRKNFGITLEDYARMFAAQDGKCAICLEHETVLFKGRPTSLSVDHDHVTGKVRGLLCRKCNAGLGNLKDSIELLEAALTYLKRYL